MTTATAATGATTTPAGTEDGTTGTELEQSTGTESLLTGQEGEEAADPTDVEAAMLAGFARATGKPADDTDDDATRLTDTGKKPGEGQDAADGKPAATQTPPADQDDPEVPGLGMKASEVKARFGKLETLEKTLASANGHIGHLKQQIQNAGKGKTITAESLKKVTEEFGAEYAQALAEDLNAAGIGGGSSVDEETLGRIVGERMQTERESMSQDMERRLVRARHADAADYFKDGKHNAEFSAFIGTLPAERQQELADTWDSGAINAALDDFKAHKAKADTAQAKQQRRVERATTPTAARGAPVAPPGVDPIEAGWNAVRGRGRGHQPVGARR